MKNFEFDYLGNRKTWNSKNFEKKTWKNLNFAQNSQKQNMENFN